MSKDAAREIFPVTMGDSELFTDFRALPLPADTPEEEEAADPKGGSAPEPASSPDSPNPSEPLTPARPAQHPAARATTPPRVPGTGSQTS